MDKKVDKFRNYLDGLLLQHRKYGTSEYHRGWVDALISISSLVNHIFKDVTGRSTRNG